MDIIVREERRLTQIKFLEFDTIIFMDFLYEASRLKLGLTLNFGKQSFENKRIIKENH